MFPRLDDNHVFIIQYRMFNTTWNKENCRKFQWFVENDFYNKSIIKKKCLIFWHMYNKVTHQRVFKANSFLYEYEQIDIWIWDFHLRPKAVIFFTTEDCAVLCEDKLPNFFSFEVILIWATKMRPKIRYTNFMYSGKITL